MSPFEKDAGGIFTNVLTKNVMIRTKIVSDGHFKGSHRIFFDLSYNHT